MEDILHTDRHAVQWTVRRLRRLRTQPSTAIRLRDERAQPRIYLIDPITQVVDTGELAASHRASVEARANDS
ncbi:hypothetical protein GCM10027569_14280 [Flindersiella endophytica]